MPDKAGGRILSRRAMVVALLCLMPWGSAHADRQLDKAAYTDKLRGMWFGELIGNYAGRPTEGQYTLESPVPDALFAWDLHESCGDPWTGDDDTNVEYLYLHALETYGAFPTFQQLQTEWRTHIGLNGFFIANRQAIYLMSHGFDAPDTGSWRYNLHAYAIDCQITTESLGAYSPGLRQWAIDTVGRCSRISNDGYPVHAAQFYAAMYAAAAFDDDVESIITQAQACIPVTSRSSEIINDVRTWYAQDMLDGVPDWQATRQLMYAKYRYPANGRFRLWVESTINLGCTVTALLYGAGDFEETIRIAVLLGFDNDCNPATAGGLIGLIEGYSNLPASLTSTATDCYRVDFLSGLPVNESISAIAARMADVAEAVVIAQGGASDGVTIMIPDESTIATEPERFDPTGPGGLVGAVLQLSGQVTTGASRYYNIPTHDRIWLDGVIDGITDVTYNGHLAYWTNDGDNPQPAEGDYYALMFDRPLRFDSVTYYEGDATYYLINDDPRVVEPIGGYFLDLVVEVHGANGWRTATNLQLSEPLEPLAFYQVIDLTFDPIVGDGVRIRGTAGGRYEYTTVLELECRGGLAGDFDDSLSVDLDDIPPFVDALIGAALDPQDIASADINADDQIDGRDVAAFVTLLGG
ncbi:MAG: ADP-ribosylglycohydrolase family protein [Phycisphaerales bacterium]|nr:ADP-ribosylglycohydrolase family protein [Phycisphaerales bacterium]